MSDRPVLLLDLGGVLADLGDPVTAMQLEFTHDEFWKTWIASPAVRDLETGVIDEATFILRIAHELGAGDDPEFASRLHRWRLQLFPESEPFLKAVSSEWRLALLSNTNAIHWRQVTDSTDIFDAFDMLFLSYETGQYKPSPEAYEQVVQHYGCAAREVRFFDDSAANIEAARAVGLDAHLCRGVPAL
ncbi:MAG: HAD-IA family hydrolase [Pseudomonadota bacterium]